MTNTYDVVAGSEGNKIFGNLLKTQRLSCRMSADDVSKKVFVNPSFINGIERGVQAPSLTTAIRILDAVGMSFVTDKDASDVAIYYEDRNRWVGFRFKAAIRGQNRRPDVDQELSRRTRRGKSALSIRRDALDLAVASNRYNAKTEEIIDRAKAFEAYLIGEEQ